MLSVIFDVDGVIIDVRESYHYCIKETAEHFLNKEIDIQTVRKLKFESGINNDYHATLYIVRYFGGDTKLEDIIYLFDRKYEEHRDKEKLILSHSFFENLINNNLRLGILTGRPRKDLDYVFKRFDLFSYFDCIVDDDTIKEEGLKKPNPFALNLCLISMSSSKGVYIGDSLADYQMWMDYRTRYDEPIVDYIHFGSNVNLEGVKKAKSEEELNQTILNSFGSLKS